MYINFSAIHYPNCHYVEGKMKDDKGITTPPRCNMSTVSYPVYFRRFQKRGNTLVIALS